MLMISGAIFVLLILSAFFSGSETALTGASRPLMHQLEVRGNRSAGVVNRLYDKKGPLLGAILLGNNLVNILASALATSVLIGTFGEAGIAYATILMTALIVLFSEILPKTYAMHNADRFALAVAPVMRRVVQLFSPLTWATQILVRGVLGLFGMKLSPDEPFVPASEELRGAIELHEGDHRAVRHERAMLRSVLDLSEVEVAEIMVHRKTVFTVNADDPPNEILDQILASPYTRLPLWRGETDNVIGVVHVKEILRALNSQEGATGALDIEALSSPPWFVPETTRLLDQLEAFRNRREHFALVVDEYGSLMGVVTLEDILEEIVGDISDEHDITVPGLDPQPDGSLIVDGQFTIRDLNRQMEWSLPDEEAATVAGLVLHESRRIPDEGQVFIFFGFRFEILRRERHQITSIRISPPRKNEDPRGESSDTSPKFIKTR
ncbi:MAG: HlyC/CorC family transporter [Pseudomonadota bacterium]|nr:HlyC/CorC family transporter [Pseudomonadota bacterium]